MVRNVIIVNDSCNIDGGAAEIAVNTAIALASHGIQPIYFCCSGYVDKRLREIEVKVICLALNDITMESRTFSRIGRGIWNRCAARRIGNLLKKFDPKNTVLHVHTWTKCMSSSIFREARRRGFKIAVTLHDYFVVCPNGGLFDYRKMEPCYLKPLSINCILRNCDRRSYSHKLYRLVRQLVQQWRGNIPSHDDLYLAVSNFSQTTVAGLVEENTKIIRIDNPVASHKETRVNPGNNRDFCYIGRVSAEKGVNIFVDAVIGSGAEGKIVGDTSRVPKGGVEHRLPATGWLDKNGVKEQVKKARCVVLPSVWYETQGLVVSEAASVGVPAIVPAGTAAEEFVVDGETGLLFERGNARDLAEKIYLLDHDDELVTKLGRQSYERYWASPKTLNVYGRMLIEAYETLLKT